MSHIFDWKCECGKDSSKLGRFEELVPNDSRSHRPELCAEPACECGKKMTNYGAESGHHRAERKIDAVFDFVFQIWRKQDGSPILDADTKDTWVSPCPSCTGPANMTSYDSFFEYYECLNCGHESKGN